jgi:hypothetical protein
MNRKGQISSVFNYLFAILVGGAVFVFLIGFGFQFISLSGSLGAQELVTSFNDEFAAFYVAQSGEKIVDYGRELDFVVINGQIISNGQGKTIDHVLFSPTELQGEQIFMATKAVELPYRVGNAFYVADGKTLYVLVHDTQTEEVVTNLVLSFDSLPKNFPSKVFSINDLEGHVDEILPLTSQYEHVQFVFFTSYDDVLSDISSLIDSYTILQVRSVEEDFSYGEVDFPTETVSYYGFPLLIGAIVSSESEGYSFMFDRVMQKTVVVTDIYNEKAKFVSARLPTCSYALMKSSLSSYTGIIGEDVSYTSYKLKVDKVEQENKVLGGDCPEIF